MGAPFNWDAPTNSIEASAPCSASCRGPSTAGSRRRTAPSKCFESAGSSECSRKASAVCSSSRRGRVVPGPVLATR